jgi:transposase-like protein
MGARGPKTSYNPDYCDEARRACGQGASNEELARLFGVSASTIHNWIEEFPDFRKAVEEARDGASCAPGSRTGYSPDFCAEARRACMLGVTNEELGAMFGVTRATIHNWMQEFPDFRKAIEEGKVSADARVAEKLYQRAIGYERPATRFFANPTGDPTRINYTYHHAPHTPAAIFWLRSRRREDWREQIEHRHSTSHELLVVLEAARLRARPGDSRLPPVAALPAPTGGAPAVSSEAGAQDANSAEDGDVRSN